MCVLSACSKYLYDEWSGEASLLNYMHDELSSEVVKRLSTRGGGLGSRPIFKKFHETYAPS